MLWIFYRPTEKNAPPRKLHGSVLKYERPLGPLAEECEWDSFSVLRKGSIKYPQS